MFIAAIAAAAAADAAGATAVADTGDDVGDVGGVGGLKCFATDHFDFFGIAAAAYWRNFRPRSSDPRPLPRPEAKVSSRREIGRGESATCLYITSCLSFHFYCCCCSFCCCHFLFLSLDNPYLTI